jgi:hypothetical protein
VGNALVNAVFEIISRNNINTVEINLEDVTEEYNNWLQNDGILLTDCMIEKTNIIQQLKTRNEDGSFVISRAEKRNMKSRWIEKSCKERD